MKCQYLLKKYVEIMSKYSSWNVMKRNMKAKWIMFEDGIRNDLKTIWCLSIINRNEEINILNNEIYEMVKKIWYYDDENIMKESIN